MIVAGQGRSLSKENDNRATSERGYNRSIATIDWADIIRSETLVDVGQLINMR